MGLSVPTPQDRQVSRGIHRDGPGPRDLDPTGLRELDREVARAQGRAACRHQPRFPNGQGPASRAHPGGFDAAIGACPHGGASLRGLDMVPSRPSQPSPDLFVCLCTRPGTEQIHEADLFTGLQGRALRLAQLGQHGSVRVEHPGQIRIGPRSPRLRRAVERILDPAGLPRQVLDGEARPTPFPLGLAEDTASIGKLGLSQGKPATDRAIGRPVQCPQSVDDQVEIPLPPDQTPCPVHAHGVGQRCGGEAERGQVRGSVQPAVAG